MKKLFLYSVIAVICSVGFLLHDMVLSVYAQGNAGTVELVNPIGGSGENPSGTTSIPAIIGMIIQAALGIAGSIALVAFIYGSFLWLTSAGKSERIQQGMRTMMYAAIGLFVIFASYGILGQVIDAIVGG